MAENPGLAVGACPSRGSTKAESSRGFPEVNSSLLKHPAFDLHLPCGSGRVGEVKWAKAHFFLGFSPTSSMETVREAKKIGGF